jgi:hypothetical protein
MYFFLTLKFARFFTTGRANTAILATTESIPPCSWFDEKDASAFTFLPFDFVATGLRTI